MVFHVIKKGYHNTTRGRKKEEREGGKQYGNGTGFRLGADTYAGWTRN